MIVDVKALAIFHAFAAATKIRMLHD
jgi:hypothetical protein